MAVFTRPCTWHYDLGLFREAVADEDRLEELMGAIARDDQQLLVAESNEEPAAFAWLAFDDRTVRLLRLHVADNRPVELLFRSLIDRIESDHGATTSRTEVSRDAISGIEDEGLWQAGFEREGSAWVRHAQ